MKTPLLQNRPFNLRHRLRHAFSLVEVTLALGIITFGLVGVVGVLPTALISGRQSFDQNRATAIANTLFTSFRSQPFQNVGYLDVQFDSNGKAQTSSVPTLDLNSSDPSQSGLTPPHVQFHAVFTENVAGAAMDTYSEQRHLSFATQASTSGADYLVTMYFNNQPDGMSVAPQSSTTPNGTPIVPAQANRIELVIAAFSRPKDQYHFVSTVANRTN